MSNQPIRRGWGCGTWQPAIRDQWPGDRRSWGCGTGQSGGRWRCWTSQSGEPWHAANEKPTFIAEAAALANQGKVEDVDCIDQSGEVKDAVFDSPWHVTNEKPTVAAKTAALANQGKVEDDDCLANRRGWGCWLYWPIRRGWGCGTWQPVTHGQWPGDRRSWDCGTGQSGGRWRCWTSQSGEPWHAANEKPTVVAEAAALANQGKNQPISRGWGCGTWQPATRGLWPGDRRSWDCQRSRDPLLTIQPCTQSPALNGKPVEEKCMYNMFPQPSVKVYRQKK